MSQNVRVTLTKLRDVFRRIDRGTLDADDWPIVRALFSKEIARCERRQAKMLAKLADEAAEEESEATGSIIDAEYAVVDSRHQHLAGCTACTWR